MDFEELEKLKPGATLYNEDIQRIFKCGNSGGMRRSLKTNSLVLISDENNSLYKDMWKLGDVWQFVGMGRIGDQSLDYLQNKTLFRSNDTGVNLYLLRGELKKSRETIQKYTFIGKVLLAGQPYELADQLDEENKKRKVFIFPLIETGIEKNFVNFINSFSKHELRDKGILEFPNYALSLNSVDNMIKLLREKGIDTVTGHGGWFLTQTGHFYNPNTESRWKIGNINLITENNEINSRIVFQGQNKYLNPYYRTSVIYLDETKSVDDTDGSEDSNSTSLGLRIKRLKYESGHNNEQIDIQFIHNGDIYNHKKPFSTLLIGPNGTGKSTILSALQKILLDLYYIAESKESNLFSSKEIKYELSYYLGDNNYVIKRNNSTLELLKDEKNIGFSKKVLPQKFIACAFNISDKFTYQSSQEDVIDRYQYLGVKSSDSEAIIGEISRNLVQNIMRSSQENNFLSRLKNITNFINVEPVVRVVFNTTDKKGIFSSVNKENINNLQRKYISNQRKRKKSNNINIVEYQEIMDFLTSIRENKFHSTIFKIDDKSITINFDLDSHEIYETYFYELNTVWHLFEIGIFQLPSIKLKKEKYFKLEDASSGEGQYFSTMVNILAKIQPNSVIVIDEPETSLHPNWQNKYIYGLNEIFKKYPTCHFIMATHSHFLISDLEPRNSSIVSLVRKTFESKAEVKLHDEDTFGWSVEDILFNIFGLPTNRNYYVADELDKILLAISLRDVNDDIRSKVTDFVDIYPKMKKNDPLRDVLKLIFEKVGINV
ncbi:AAA family ATPase [Mesobacillus foraminis]|uniref:AAA family ATPase n=1 Tax=Mesobacillus foraminis TaxID=279826 RepID=UPI000EF4C40B|nr:AAA family ATPase [Mesobacillus foraminis]